MPNRQVQKDLSITMFLELELHIVQRMIFQFSPVDSRLDS
jgi:hypothetical protein